MTLTRRLAVLAVGLAAAVMTPRPALAQLGLPESIIGAQSVSASDQAQIRQYVEANKSGLSSGEPAAIRRSRTALLQPLRAATVSAPFRLAYADALKGDLAELVTSPNEDIAVNALRLAGELATRDTVGLLRAGLSDAQRVPIRIAAAFGYKDVFETIGGGATPAITTQQAQDALVALRAALIAEQDPIAADAMVMAIGAAGVADPSAEFQGIRDQAVETLVETLSDKPRRVEDPLAFAPVLIRGAAALQSAVTARATPLNRASVQRTAVLAGSILRLAAQRAGQEQDPERVARLVVLVERAESLLFFAERSLAGNATEGNLARLLREGNVDEFQRGVEQFIGREGRLLRAPFSLPADTFRR